VFAHLSVLLGLSGQIRLARLIANQAPEVGRGQTAGPRLSSANASLLGFCNKFLTASFQTAILSRVFHKNENEEAKFYAFGTSLQTRTGGYSKGWLLCLGAACNFSPEGAAVIFPISLAQAGSAIRGAGAFFSLGFRSGSGSSRSSCSATSTQCPFNPMRLAEIYVAFMLDA